MKFKIDCLDEIFDDEEISILEKWGNFFYDLVNGKRKVDNDRRKKIIEIYDKIIKQNIDIDKVEIINCI